MTRLGCWLVLAAVLAAPGVRAQRTASAPGVCDVVVSASGHAVACANVAAGCTAELAATVQKLADKQSAQEVRTESRERDRDTLLRHVRELIEAVTIVQRFAVSTTE